MLIDIFTWLLTLPAIVLAVPCLVFAAQVLLSYLAKSQPVPHGQAAGPRPSVAVLVPAHNESSGLLATLQSVQAQLGPNDRLLVVADNCTDDTAAVATAAGAEVVERFNTELRGKGYALDHGFKHLSGQPCDVLIIVDADCLVSPGCLERIAREAVAHQRPVQALYLIHNQGAGNVQQRFSEFACRVRNLVRPLGMHALGLPCQLMGTGMAFPWALLQRHSLASGHLVEDMQLGLAMAADGHPPRFCPQAEVTSAFPTDTAAQQTQRTRWEHGHLSMIAQALPPFMKAWLKAPSVAGLAMACDLAVPPLSLLVGLQGGVFICSLAWVLITHQAMPFFIASAALLALGVAVLAAWRSEGSKLLRPADFLLVSRYIFSKFSIYFKFITARQTEWVRSKRNADDQ